MLITCAFCIVGYVALSSAYGPKIPVQQGRGWDGTTYVNLAIDFPATISSGGLNSYYATRLLPSALVWVTHSTLGIAPTIPNLLRLFEVLNVLSIAWAAYNLILVARHMGWTQTGDQRGLWLLVGVLCNAAVLFVAPYYPALTDMPALALACFGLRSWVLEERVYQVIAMLLAAFTWPVLMGLQLIIFAGNQSASINHQHEQALPYPVRIQRIVLGAFCALYLLISFYSYFVHGSGLRPAFLATAPIPWLVPLAWTSTCIVLWIVGSTLMEAAWQLRSKFVTSWSWTRLTDRKSVV